jgi:AcrR family transcriptional regulator
MSMESQTELAPRRIPIQERGEKRVAGLLEAAAAIFAEVGFEAATMRDIAERAGASIGSLYQFFPNKEVVARAIKTQYCQELKKLWASLVAVSAKTTTSRLVDQFLNVTIRAIEEHPAIKWGLTSIHSTAEEITKFGASSADSRCAREQRSRRSA